MLSYSFPCLAMGFTLIALGLFSPETLAQEVKGGASEASVAFAVQKVTVGGKDMPFRLMSPSTLVAGTKYPVILFLHGAGERGTDNETQLKHFPVKMAQADWRKRFESFVIAPQCQPNQQWVSVPWVDKTSTPMADQPNAMLTFALACLDDVRLRFADHIDPQRIYLTGLSMGGFGSWEAAARRPDLFAALVPICGGGDEKTAPLLKSMPIWAFHGTADTSVWPVRSESMVASVKQAGGQPKLTLLPGGGHDSWSTAYSLKSGLMEWIFSQKKGSTTP